MNKERETASLPLFGIPRLIPYLRPYRNRVIRMIILALICSVIDVSYPLFGRYALDHFVAGKTLEGMPLFIVIYLLVLAFQSVINDRTMVDSGTVEMSIDRDLRNKAFNHLQTLSFSYFNRNSVGYIHARVMSDTGKIGEAVSWRMMDCIWNGSYILFAIFVMMMTEIRLALWMIFLLAAAGILIWLFQNRLVAANRLIREINSRITGSFNEGIIGARTIKLLQRGDGGFQKGVCACGQILRDAHFHSDFDVFRGARRRPLAGRGADQRRAPEDRNPLRICLLCCGNG